MSQTTLFVCSLCQFSKNEPKRDGLSGGQHFINQLTHELQHRNLEEQVHIEPLRCMAACHQPCNVTLAAPGKLTFILSGLSPTESAPMVSEFCQQYTQSSDGRVPYGERALEIRKRTAFVLPPLPASPTSP